MSLYESVRESLLKLGPGHPVLRSAIRLQARASGFKVATSPEQLMLSKGDRRMLLPSGQYLMVPYAVHMWDQLFDTVTPEVQDQTAVLDFSKPGLHRYTQSGLTFWSPGMIEEDSMQAYTAAYQPKPGEVIWDVGAHGGFTTYYFSRMVGPTGRVYAFEPDDHTYDYLLRNIALHKLENVIPVKKALAGETGTALFSMDGSLGAGLTNFTDTADKRQIREVETISFEDACREFKAPALVKMDIEGAEVPVVAGALSVLKENKIHFAIETEHRINREYTWVPITRMLSGIGYSVRTELYEGQHFTWAGPNQLEMPLQASGHAPVAPN
jgi:FkbM family methyltransferase